MVFVEANTGTLVQISVPSTVHALVMCPMFLVGGLGDVVGECGGQRGRAGVLIG